MKAKLITGVPEHEKGSFHDTESIRLIEDHENTIDHYKTLKDRLLSVNYWNYYANGVGADFKLHDKEGNLKKRIPEKGDFIRIDIPGPATLKPEDTIGYRLQICMKSTLMTEKCWSFYSWNAGLPLYLAKLNTHTAHFYTAEASSTFIISREKDCIKLGIYGRNETPNLDAQIADKARNLAIALGGMVGISKIQWKILTDTLVEF